MNERQPRAAISQSNSRSFAGFAATLALLLLAGFGCGGGDSSEPAETDSPSGAETSGTPGDGATETEMSAPAEAPEGATDLATAAGPVVAMRTSLGELRMELYADDAPDSVANFLQYVDDGFYEGTIFHRVIRGFMIQGGGFTPEMMEKETRAPIQNEAQNGLRNLRGTLAMARTMDPHSASSQFYINTVDNAGLDHTAPTMNGWGYAVFGKLISGLDVLDRIAAAAVVSRAGHNDVPETPIVIESATVVSR